MKLCLPHPGYFEALKQIIKKSKEEVQSVYMGGVSDYMGSLRANLQEIQLQDIAAHTKYAHEHGIKMEIALNSTCLSGQHLTIQGFNMYHAYLRKLEEIGVDSVIVAEPYLVEMISKEFDMEIVVSCLAFIEEPQKALFYEELGADTLTLSPDIIRDFHALDAIRDVTNGNLRIMLNEGCLYKCPFRHAHYNLISHRAGPKPKPFVQWRYYFNRCTGMRIRNPELIIKSNWIRPEDIREYEKIGIESFKISGRIQSVNWIINAMEAYARRNYKGNILNIIDHTKDISHLFYLANEELGGVMEKWKGCECDRRCKKCGFCKELTYRILRVYAGKGTKNEHFEPYINIKQNE